MRRIRKGGLLASLALVVLGVAACGEPPVPEIASFGIAPAAVHTGEAAELTWSTRNAVSFRITRSDGVEVDLAGLPAGGGSLEIVPEAPGQITFTLTATGEAGAGETTATATLDVTWPPARVVTFEASPDVVIEGGSATLAWEVAEAVQVDIVDGSGAALELADDGAPTGTVQVAPGETTTYTLTAHGRADDAVTAHATVTVDHPARVDAFTSDAQGGVLAGTEVTLSWSTRHTQSVRIRDESGTTIVESDQGQGTALVTPEVTTAYTLEATGVHGVATVDLTVDVVAVVDAFSLTPATARAGDPLTLSWRTSGASSVVLKGPDGYRYEPPREDWGEGTTTAPATVSGDYLITATSTWNVRTEMRKLEVTTAPRVRELTATPEAVTAGETVRVAWRVDGAEWLELTVAGEAVDVIGLDASQDGVDVVLPDAGDVEVALTAWNATDPVDNRHTVRLQVPVLPVPRVERFAALPAVVPAGGTVHLLWDTFGADTVRITKDGLPMDLGALPADGSEADTVVADATYVLYARSPLGVEVPSDPVQVVIGEATVTAFEANPKRVAPGAPVTFTWSTLGGTRVDIADEEGQVLHSATSPTEVAEGAWMHAGRPELGDYEYTVTLTAEDGATAQATAGFSVTDGPSIVRFEAEPTRVTEGDEVVLSWLVLNDYADAVPVLTLEDQSGQAYSLDGADPNEGIRKISLPTPGIYHLTLAASTGLTDDLRTVVVEVVPAPSIVSFTADPEGLTTEGGSIRPTATLTWQADGAAKAVVSLDQGGGNFVPLHTTTNAQEAEHGSVEVQPEVSSLYMLEVFNAAESSRRSTLLVTVDAPRILQFDAVNTLDEPIHALVTGDAARLVWNVQDADTVLLTPIEPAKSVIPTRLTELDETSATRLELVDDVAYLPFPDGFTFPFEGLEWRGIQVALHGYLNFDPSEKAETVNDNLPSTTSPHGGIIAPFWDKLFLLETGGIFWSQGTDPESGDYVVIQWAHIAATTSTTYKTDLNFEVRLFANGLIEFHYGTMTAVNSTHQKYADGYGADIGLEYIGGEHGYHLYNGTGSGYSGGLTNTAFRLDLRQEDTGVRPVTPTKSVVYVLSASNGNGLVRKAVSLDVYKPARLLTTSVAPLLPEAGRPFDITWSARDSVRLRVLRVEAETEVELCSVELTADKTWSAGCTDERPEPGRYTYRVEAVGGAGDVAAQDLSVTVNPVLDVVSLTANGQPEELVIQAGEEVVLAWETVGATKLSLLLDGVPLEGAPVPLPSSGTHRVHPTASTIYELRVLDEATGRERARSVGVYLSPARITHFESDVLQVPPGGGDVVLTWDTTDAETVTVLPGYQQADGRAFKSLYLDPAGRDITPANLDESLVPLDTAHAFAFPFGGERFTQFVVSTNGWIGLGTNHPDPEPENLALPVATTKRTLGFLAPLWGDLDGLAGRTRLLWSIAGRAPNRTLTVEWYRFSVGDDTALEGLLTFQAVLYENGDVEYRILENQVGPSAWPGGTVEKRHDGAGFTIGYQGFDGEDFVQVGYGQYTCVPYPYYTCTLVPMPEKVQPGTSHSLYIGDAGASGSRTLYGVDQDTTFEACATGARYTDCRTIEVQAIRAGELLFTELMLDPATGDGEFVEVRNVSTRALDVAGWTLTNGQPDGVFQIPADAPRVLEPGDLLVLARSAAPGFTPDLAYGAAAPGLTLPAPAGRVALELRGGTVDEVAWDAGAGWTLPAGAALGLDPSLQFRVDDAVNDVPADMAGTVWCAEPASPGARGEGCRRYGGRYVAAPFEGEWIDISATGQRLPGAETQNGFERVPGGLGFSMPFFDGTATDLWISSRGFASFVPLRASYTGYGYNRAIPDMNEPQGFVAPFWENLYVRDDGSTRVYAETRAVDGHQVAIVQWQDVEAGMYAGRATFQAQLWESGDVYFLYRTLQPDADKEADWLSYLGGNATVGLESLDASTGVQFSYNPNEPALYPGLRIHYVYRP